jgi:mannosyltransferase
LQSKGGISHVFSQLIKGLQLVKSIELCIFSTTHRPINNFYFKQINLRVKRGLLNVPKYLAQFTPILFYHKKKCIFHLTYYNFLLTSSNVVKVITIHDFGYEHKIMRKGLRRSINICFKKLAIWNANAIICVSENTKTDLYRFYANILSGKSVRVIYNGIDEAFFKENDEDRLIQQKYILFVGSRATYKQFHLAIILIERLPNTFLVIAGGENLSPNELKSLKKIAGRYLFDTNVSVLKLRNYYKYAECLFYPSLYEGFGLPVIEANACGCPVIGGFHSSIKEISNGLNYLVKNNEIESYIEIYYDMINNFDQEHRQMLIDNAKNFKVENFIKNTQEFYKDLLNK